jgi:PadR family transcriptional regulator PadR
MQVQERMKRADWNRKRNDTNEGDSPENTETVLKGTERRNHMGFQVGAALLDACVLSVLQREDTYGYVLTQTLKEVLGISESTLYPVLKRLQRDGCLTTYDKPWQGRNRRYYAITEEGGDRTEVYRRDWKEYKSKVDKLLFGGDFGE